jgi:hypothetical protein
MAAEVLAQHDSKLHRQSVVGSGDLVCLAKATKQSIAIKDCIKRATEYVVYHHLTRNLPRSM